MLKAKDFRTRAWNNISGKWGTLALITLVTSLIMGAGSSVGGIGALLLMGPISLGLAQVHLKVVRKESVAFEDAFAGFKNFGNSFLLALLNELFIFLWSLLFIIPGIIKSYAYSMSYFILADNPNMDPNEARKQSIAMMDGNKWRLFCLDMSFFGWFMLCLLTFGILSYWIDPYQQVSHAEFYQQLLIDQGRIPSQYPGAWQNPNGQYQQNGYYQANGGYPQQGYAQQPNAGYPQQGYEQQPQQSNAGYAQQPQQDGLQKGGNTPPIDADKL